MPESAVRRAVVLAAGRGTRMGEATAELPKPMLAVHGRPMLEHVLENLAGAGVERFVLVVGYRREAILEHFRGGGCRSIMLSRKCRTAPVRRPGSREASIRTSPSC